MRLFKVKDKTKYHFYKPLLKLVIICLCMASLYAFDQVKKNTTDAPKDLIPPLVQKELEIKINKYKKTILDKCYEKVLEEAEIYIDSLVSEELKLQASDTLKFPAKPVRPELREPIRLDDSTEIAPIIKN